MFVCCWALLQTNDYTHKTSLKKPHARPQILHPYLEKRERVGCGSRVDDGGLRIVGRDAVHAVPTESQIFQF
jgi:hypothetical protein